MVQLAVSTVLTVEDDPIVRDDLRTLLEREGFVVLAGALDGVEAALRIREERDVPIVARTGYSEMLVERALQVGAAGYVRKPFAGGEVVSALRGAIHSHAERSVEAGRERSRPRPALRARGLRREGIGVELERRAHESGTVWRIVG